MKDRWLPKDAAGRRAHLVEEAGEVLKALGKCERFGMRNRHPEFPTLMNVEVLLAELHDLREAIDAMIPDIRKELTDA